MATRGWPSGETPMRLSRATVDLPRARRFYVDALGMRELWSTPGDDHNHALLMVGFAGARWHLELIADPEAAEASHPGPEDLLVLYLGGTPDGDLVDRLVAAGGQVRPGNEYWSQWGISLDDPDGHRLVLSQRSWPVL